MAVSKSTEPSKRKQSKKEESDTRDSEDSEDYSDIAAEEGQSDETADEENGDDLEPTPKRPRGRQANFLLFDNRERGRIYIILTDSGDIISA